MSKQPTALLVNRRMKRLARRDHSVSHRLIRIGAGTIAAVGLVLAAALLVGSIAYAKLTAELPSIELLPVLLDPQKGLLLEPTRLYDRSGEHLIYSLENAGVPRRYAPLDPDVTGAISPILVQVTLAVLEPNFWQNPGFSTQSITAAQPETIAERLVDELLLANEPPSVRRALRMRLLAAQLVAHYGRSQVLEWYLNSASFGRLAFGVDSAARLYLGKPSTDVTLGEAALLVGIIDAPALNPMDSPAAALERQAGVLTALLAQGIIDPASFEQVIDAPLQLKEPLAEQPTIALAFSKLALNHLYQIYGQARVEQGGLTVVTTLDYDLQVQTACAMLTQLRRVEGDPAAVARFNEEECKSARLLPTLPPAATEPPAGLAASGVLLDLEEGQVLALVGDLTADGSESPFLRAHPPGSLLNPFVAVAGFTRGMSPASLVWDIPANLPPALQAEQTDFHGPQRFRMALVNDYLAPVAQVVQQIGPANVWRLSEPFGLSLATLGADPLTLISSGGSVSPLQIAQAYSTFALSGSQIGQPETGSSQLKPTVILQVGGAAGFAADAANLPHTSPVLAPQIAYQIHHTLSDETARWPSLGYPNALEIGRPAGAKIGRVAGDQEFWTAGYTRQHLAVFWLGNPTQESDQDGSARLEPGMAAGMWHALIQYASQGLPIADWTPPQGIATVTVCDPSGLLPTIDCPSTVDEIFAFGSEPREMDTLFRKIQINRETRLLATVFTPLELIQEQTYLIPPPEAEEWARSAGYTLPPTGYDVIFAPASVEGLEITSPVIFSYVHGTAEIRGTAAGQDFASYRLQAGQGLNPRDWLQVGEPVDRPVENGVLGEWDTDGLDDGLYALRLVVVRSDQRLDTAIIQVTVDNQAPNLQVVSPAHDEELSAAQQRSVFFDALIEDAVGIDRVEWVVDGQKVSETRSAPYQFFWPAGRGDHELLVRAYDLAGNAAESEIIPFTVK